jgi:phage terminase large subunit
MLNSNPSTTSLLIAVERERRRRKRATSAAAPVFRGAAAEAQVTRAHEWMLAGPAETGKTFAALWRLDTEARRWPGSQWALVRKLRSTMDGTVLQTWRRVIAIRGGVTVYGGEKPQWYDYPNGARVWVGGLDNPDKILSGERDGIYVNQAEELSVGDWQTLSTRATGRGAVTDTPMLFGDCNPSHGQHWIINRPSLQVLHSRHEDNPTLYDGAGALTEQGERTMRVLDALTGVFRERLRWGRWVGAEGQYFETWDERLHTCAPFDVPTDWPVWGAFDYGFTHPTAFGVFTEHDGVIYLIGEHVQHKWLPAQHALAMAALLDRLGIPRHRLRRIVAGHDVFASRGDSQGKTIAEQYKALGWVFEHAQIDRINGAAALLGRLGNPALGQAPTFKVWATCPRTIATIPALVHDPHRPEDVLKTNADADGRGGDDPYDMARYGLMAAQQRRAGGQSNYMRG